MNVVVNFLSQVISVFLLLQLDQHTLSYPKTKEKQKLPEVKINYNPNPKHRVLYFSLFLLFPCVFFSSIAAISIDGLFLYNPGLILLRCVFLFVVFSVVVTMFVAFSVAHYLRKLMQAHASSWRHVNEFNAFVLSVTAFGNYRKPRCEIISFFVYFLFDLNGTAFLPEKKRTE